MMSHMIMTYDIHIVLLGLVQLLTYLLLVTSGCSAVCLFSLVSNCSPPLLVYCIFLGPRA